MHFEFGGNPMDMPEYIARTRRYIEPRLDDIPMAWRPQHPEVPAWSPDLERAVSIYIILDVIRTQVLKTELKFQAAKDKMNNADLYELKRVMAQIEDRI